MKADDSGLDVVQEVGGLSAKGCASRSRPRSLWDQCPAP